MDEAIKAWQEAVGINPSGDANTPYCLGKALVLRHRYVEALLILRATLEVSPVGDRRGETLDRLEVAYLASGEDAQALALLDERLKTIRTKRGPDHQANTTPSYEDRRLLSRHAEVCRKLVSPTKPPPIFAR